MCEDTFKLEPSNREKEELEKGTFGESASRVVHQER